MQTAEAAAFDPIRSSPQWGGRATRAEISLDAIEANARQLKRAAGGARLMAVVKANAYGHGSAVVARAAIAGGADWLGVYAPEEGMVLRGAGLTAPVLVFGPFTRQEAVQMLRAGITPTVTDLSGAEALESVASTSFPVHLKVDTGLTRAGIPAGEAAALAKRLARFRRLTVQGVYTHFASADEPDPRTTLEQMSVFETSVEQIRAVGLDVQLVHAANSAATLDFPASRLDMVRTGISLYGYYPSPTIRNRIPLRPALTLVSNITRVRSVPPGTGVGYGHEFRCARPTVIALVPIGYGDGLPRSLGHGRGRVVVRGGLAPIVGRVSMDQITVDATDIRDVALGDSVVLIGAQEGTAQTAEDVADQAGTISYDILTGLMPRIPRLYARGGRVDEVETLMDSREYPSTDNATR